MADDGAICVLMTRARTAVTPRGPLADPDTPETWLAAAVTAAIGDPAAIVTVDAWWVTVQQDALAPHGLWHAVTPEEWCGVIGDPEEDGRSLDALAALGLLDAELDWAPGWPPEEDEEDGDG